MDGVIVEVDMVVVVGELVGSTNQLLISGTCNSQLESRIVRTMEYRNRAILLLGFA